MTHSRATGSENYQLPSVAGSGVYRCRRVAGAGVLPVQECCWLQEESAVPILTGKEPASNPVLTAGSPVTGNYRFRSAVGSRVLPVPESGAGYREIYCSHAY